MKRSEQLKTLSWEHHDGLKIALRIKNDLNKFEQPKHLIAYVLQNYNNALKLHFKQEEESLVAPLQKNKNVQDSLQRMLREHKQFAEIIAKIEQLDMSVFEHISAFGKLLEQHIRFEERELFPLIERELSKEQLYKIANYLKQEHQKFIKSCQIEIPGVPKIRF